MHPSGAPRVNWTIESFGLCCPPYNWNIYTLYINIHCVSGNDIPQQHWHHARIITLECSTTNPFAILHLNFNRNSYGITSAQCCESFYHLFDILCLGVFFFSLSVDSSVFSWIGNNGKVNGQNGFPNMSQRGNCCRRHFQVRNRLNREFRAESCLFQHDILCFKINIEIKQAGKETCIVKAELWPTLQNKIWM